MPDEWRKGVTLILNASGNPRQNFFDDNCNQGCEFYFGSRESTYTDDDGNSVFERITSGCPCFRDGIGDNCFDSDNECLAGHSKYSDDRDEELIDLPPMGFSRRFFLKNGQPHTYSDEYTFAAVVGVIYLKEDEIADDDDGPGWFTTECYRGLNLYGEWGKICWGSSDNRPKDFYSLPHSYGNSVFNEDLQSQADFEQVATDVRDELEDASDVTKLPPGTLIISEPDAIAGGLLLVHRDFNPQAWFQFTASGISPCSDTGPGEDLIISPLLSYTHTITDPDGEPITINGWITPPTPANRCWFLTLHPDMRETLQLIGQIPVPTFPEPCASPTLSSSEPAALAES
jgi:hypothetical protein